MRRRSSGQALVELALALPIFLLMLSGIIDLGSFLHTRMSVLTAAQDGARAGVPVADVTTIPSVVENRVISSGAQSGLTLTASNIAISCVPTGPGARSSCNWSLHTATNPSGAQVGDSVRVTVSYSYAAFFPLLFGSTFSMSSTVQMVLDGALSE